MNLSEDQENLGLQLSHALGGVKEDSLKEVHTHQVQRKYLPEDLHLRVEVLVRLLGEYTTPEVVRSALRCTLEEADWALTKVRMELSKMLETPPDTKIAFTIGRTTSYTKALEDPRGCWKLGYRDSCEEYSEEYPGGCVWASWIEADTFRRERIQEMDLNWKSEDFSVYKILLPNGWSKDVSHQQKHLGYSNLLIDSKIECKVEGPHETK